MTKPLRLSPFKSTPSTKINTTSSIVDTRYCPECGIKMPILLCNGVPAYVCQDHRIALPIKESDSVSDDVNDDEEVS